MYKGILTVEEAQIANIDIPFNAVLNTNFATEVDENSVAIKKAGYYDVICNLQITGVTTAVSAQLYVNGAPIPGAVATVKPAATTDTPTMIIYDVVKIIPSLTQNLAKLSVRLSAGATINSGTFIIEERR